MKYFTLQNNKWEIANVYNLEESRQVNLYDFCGKTQKMVFVGIGLY